MVPLAKAGSVPWASADFQCAGRTCQLRRLYAEVGAERYVPCFTKNPSLVKITQFTFDIASNRVQATTYAQDAGPVIAERQFKDMLPTMDEVVQAAFGKVDAAYLAQNSTTLVSVSADLEAWKVIFTNTDKTQRVEVRLPMQKK